MNITENETDPCGYNAWRTHHGGHIPAQTAMPEADHDTTSDKPKSRYSVQQLACPLPYQECQSYEGKRRAEEWVQTEGGT